MDVKNSAISGTYKVTINPPFATTNNQQLNPSQVYKLTTSNNFNHPNSNGVNSNKTNNNIHNTNSNNIVVGYNN